MEKKATRTGGRLYRLIFCDKAIRSGFEVLVLDNLTYAASEKNLIDVADKPHSHLKEDIVIMKTLPLVFHSLNQIL